MLIAKICTRCGKCKPLSKFHKNKRAKDGYQAWCGKCKNTYANHYSKERRDEILAYQSQYRAEHRDEINARVCQWRCDNPDKVAAQARRRRARRAGAEGSYTTEEWYELCDEFDWRCAACGVPHEITPLTVDHVIPLSKGGNNDISNIQCLCRSCNSSKGARTIDYR